MQVSTKDVTVFQKTIFDHYQKSGRVFPWRETCDPYAILVSEVMLQQTQTERVVPFFIKWMKQFPTARTLAKAPVSAVLKAWQGLGYNRRALNLKRAGEMLVKEYGGNIPADIHKIDELPGVGPYTAGAIGAFAFNISSAFIETNIRTVYLYFFFKGRTKVSDEEILEVVKQTLPDKEKHHWHTLTGNAFVTSPRPNGNPFLKDNTTTLSRGLATPPQLRRRKEGRSQGSIREWYSALMDYGAILKTTVGNPNIHSKSYTKQSAFKGSRRQLRGKILRLVTEKGRITLGDAKKQTNAVSAEEIVSELAREGFLKKSGKSYTLA